MWHRDDPGFPPSPDPAAAAERFAEQSRYDAEPEERCDDDCPGFYVMVDTRDGVHTTLPCICVNGWPSWRWPRPIESEEVPF